MTKEVLSLKKQLDDSTNPFKVKVSIRGVDVKNSNIVDLSIRESIFDIVPVLVMTFKDYGVFSDYFSLGDDDLLNLEISTDPQLEGIKTSFLVNDYQIIPQNANTTTAYIIHLTAVLANNSMFYSVSKAFTKSTSSGALSEIFKDEDYNLVTPTKTSDTMNWLQCNISNFDMIQHIIDYSYKEDNNLVFAYVDKNYNAYIKDWKTEVKKPVSFSIKQTHDPKKLYELQLSTETKKITKLGYSFYRMGFYNGTNNKNGGYGMSGYFYDHENPKKIKIDIEGAVRYLSDYSMKHKDKVKIKNKNEFLPIKYNGDNHHSKFQVAYLQNKFLRKTLFSDVMILNSYFNDEVKLFDKVNVTIPSLAKTGANTEEVNKTYSGDYIVVGIVNQINNGGEYKSNLYLSRGGINLSAHIDKTEMKLSETESVSIRSK